MGQYWKVVNLTKKEYVLPHKLGTGLKLWEQLANHPGTGAAMLILSAAMPEPRGGGDFDLDANWHGPERKDFTKVGEMPEEYPAVAKRTIGRWAGDRIALIGDYAEDSDLKKSQSWIPASWIYALCNEFEPGEADRLEELKAKFTEANPGKRFRLYTDISDDVATVIEHELCGRYVGDGWRDFLEEGQYTVHDKEGHERTDLTVDDMKVLIDANMVGIERDKERTYIIYDRFTWDQLLSSLKKKGRKAAKVG